VSKARAEAKARKPFWKKSFDERGLMGYEARKGFERLLPNPTEKWVWTCSLNQAKRPSLHIIVTSNKDKG